MGCLELKLLDGLINHFLQNFDETRLEDDLSKVDLVNQESLYN